MIPGFKCLASYGLLGSSLGTDLVLRVLGHDIERIKRNAQFVVAWLNIVLVQQTVASQHHRLRLLALLDQLTEAGDTDALELQRELEEQ